MPKVLPKKPQVVPRETIVEKKPSVEEVRKMTMEKSNVQTKEETKKEKPVLEPLTAGQAYFEAPDGHIIIGEDSKNEVWYRQGNGGKGCFINKKR